MIGASKSGSEMVCFGETFLQGFNALSWNYEIDKKIAITVHNSIIKSISEQAMISKIAVGFGYFEIYNEEIFSSYLVINKQGIIIDNYRRISRGWKETDKTDHHYQEGDIFHSFCFNGFTIAVALCGDLWHEENVENIKKISPDIILWPVYVNFSLQKWLTEEKEYALQANKTNTDVLMINSISKKPESFGGCCYFSNGKIIRKINFGIEGMLEVEI
jgi:N-carbamoylputrescine amidase